MDQRCALGALEDIELPGYYLLPATRAGLLVRLGRDKEAPAAYDQAIALTASEPNAPFCRPPLGPASTYRELDY